MSSIERKCVGPDTHLVQRHACIGNLERGIATKKERKGPRPGPKRKENMYGEPKRSALVGCTNECSSRDAHPARWNGVVIVTILVVAR